MHVADRELATPAYRATFVNNSLGVVNGLYHAKLDCDLISSTELNRDGKRYVQDLFCPGGSYVEFKETGKRVVVSLNDKLQLPVVDVTWHRNMPSSNSGGRKYDGISKVVKSGSKRQEKIRQHERFAHFYVPNLLDSECVCPACALAKSKQEAIKSERPEHLVVKKFLDKVDWDFTDSYETGWNGEKLCLSVIDQHTGWTMNYPVKSKEQCAECLQEFCEKVGKPKAVRSDNAPEFKGEKSKWRTYCQKQVPPIAVEFSAPFTPQRNGKVERWNGTSQNAIRANMLGVDPRMWPYCSRFVSHVWNRVPKKKGGRSPFYKRHGRDPTTRYFRKFGCLCYARIHTTNQLRKMDSRYEVGIFLGYEEVNSTFLVGLWRKDSRTRSGMKFRSCKFDENIIIKDVDELKNLSMARYHRRAIESLHMHCVHRESPCRVLIWSTTPRLLHCIRTTSAGKWKSWKQLNTALPHPNRSHRCLRWLRRQPCLPRHSSPKRRRPRPSKFVHFVLYLPDSFSLTRQYSMAH